MSFRCRVAQPLLGMSIGWLLLAAGGCSSSSSNNNDSGPADATIDRRDAAADDAAADQGPPPEITCGEGTSGTLAAGGEVAVTGAAAKDLAGAAVAAPDSLQGSIEVDIACGDDLLPEGFVALGPAVAFGPAGEAVDRDLRFTLPFVGARMPAKARGGSIVVWLKRRSGKVTNLPLVNPDVDLEQGRVSFDLDELASFQVAIDARAGTTIKRRYAYRALVGFSMGGGAAAVIGMRHPDKFDVLGPLGAEPGVEMSYFLTYLEEMVLSGFCTAEDAAAGQGQIGELCPVKREPLTRQYELLSTWERMLYQPGQGVGLTLNRRTYTRALRDLIRAYGNAAYHNPDHPLLPPGVPLDFLTKSGAEVCGAPVTLQKFYDRRFNPDGSLPVITFCDGNDSSAKGLGIFDPDIKQTTPIQALVAVDVNGNGRRDSGEPIVLQSHEPYRDVGVDGKADAEEQGYDPQTNPDPAGDNHHYLKNPTGTEGNWRYDEGEPYDDVGIDGVAGTCQAGAGSPTDPCYDFGEGNGSFDHSPMADRWLDHDPARRFLALPADGQQRIDVWNDAGIRDFLNAHVASNQLAGYLAADGASVRIFDGFERLSGTSALGYDFNKVDWDNVGKHVYVRYGDPSMPAEQVEDTGDGRHVGSVLQATHRTVSFFAYAQQRWPGGDRSLENADVGSANFKKEQQFVSPTTGEPRPFAVFLPPGYFHQANADKRYPVVYFTHGYGQQPDDLIGLSSLFANYMVSPNLAPEKRFQKFLIVYVDGRCRPEGEQIPVPAVGDRCERGTFYLDSPDEQSTAQMETLLLELMDHIDQTYRTKKPETVEVPFY